MFMSGGVLFITCYFNLVYYKMLFKYAVLNLHERK